MNDNKKLKQLKKFEKENETFYKHHEKQLKQIRVNQDAYRGYIESVDGDDVEAKVKVNTNIIKSFVSSYIPHVFAKQPTVAMVKQEKVNPVDGDQAGNLYDSIELVSETSRIVLQKSMEQAKLKRHAKEMVKRKIIECGSVLKASYRKNYKQGPTVVKDIQTQQMQMDRIAAMSNEMTEDSAEFQGLMKSIQDGSYDPSTHELAEKYQSYQDSIKSLNEQVRQVSGQGLNLSVIPLMQLRWDVSKSMRDMTQGSFVAHYINESMLDAKAKYEIKEDKDDPDCRTKKWKRFSGISGNDSNDDDELIKPSDEKQKNNYVRVWERWDAVTNTVYTWIEGDIDYAAEPEPVKSYDDMFYPFFTIVEDDDGSGKLPSSRVEDMIPIQRRYDKDYKDMEEHRQAATGYMVYDSEQIDAKEFKPKIERVGVRDFIGIKTSGNPLSSLMQPAPTVPLNPALYDRSQVLFDMQQTTGLQDAERGAITKAKTLGEAQLLNDGLATRTETTRDEHEEMLEELHRYCLMLLFQEMPESEVQRIAGPYAAWPKLEETKESYFSMVNVKIEVGSSGKPNKAAEQKIWFENLEMLLGAITQVDQYRKQQIEDKDNPYYLILEETFRRLDERMDIKTIMPEVDVITSADLVQSVFQQVQQLGQQDPQSAQLAEQFLLSNPVVQQVTQQLQQAGQQQ